MATQQGQQILIRDERFASLFSRAKENMRLTLMSYAGKKFLKTPTCAPRKN